MKVESLSDSMKRRQLSTHQQTRRSQKHFFSLQNIWGESVSLPASLGTVPSSSSSTNNVPTLTKNPTFYRNNNTSRNTIDTGRQTQYRSPHTHYKTVLRISKPSKALICGKRVEPLSVKCRLCMTYCKNVSFLRRHNRLKCNLVFPECKRHGVCGKIKISYDRFWQSRRHCDPPVINNKTDKSIRDN